MAEASARPDAKKAAKPLFIAASISIFLSGFKLAAYLLTGSAIILGSLLDSISDSAVSMANYRVAILARAAPDREHPFGHGGIEVASSLVQGVVLGIFGLYLAALSISHLNHPSSLFHSDQEFYFAVGVMVVSSLGGFFIQWWLKRQQQRLHRDHKERSLSVVADAGHYAGDFAYNATNAVGLIALWTTGIEWLDGAFGLVGSVFFLRSSWPILKHAMSDLLETELPADEQKQMVQHVLSVDTNILGVHRLRMRRLGPSLFLDFHMKLPAAMSLEEAHRVGERVTLSIRRKHPRADVVIHLDPDSEPDDDYWRPSYRT